MNFKVGCLTKESSRQYCLSKMSHQLIFSLDAQICTTILFLFFLFRTRVVEANHTVIRTDILHSDASKKEEAKTGKRCNAVTRCTENFCEVIDAKFEVGENF